MSAVALEIDPPVARITLNRPEVLNAGDPGWVAELTDAVAQVAAAGERLRVAVVTGAGRAFSTGVDLKALAAGAMTLPHFLAWEDAMTAIERMPVPFIAAINGHCLGGGLQLSVLDGWWAEAYDGLNGFAIGDGITHVNVEEQDRRDASSLYDTLENQLIPLYYERDDHGLPRGWIERMKRTIRTLGWRFNTDRMVIDYANTCYLPAAGAKSSHMR